jgi:hypothetical protein
MIEGSNTFKFLYPFFFSSFTNKKDFEPLKSEDPGLNVKPKITISLFFFIFEVIFYSCNNQRLNFFKKIIYGFFLGGIGTNSNGKHYAFFTHSGNTPSQIDLEII